jgi:hypothetical protein
MDVAEAARGSGKACMATDGPYVVRLAPPCSLSPREGF